MLCFLVEKLESKGGERKLRGAVRMMMSRKLRGDYRCTSAKKRKLDVLSGQNSQLSVGEKQTCKRSSLHKACM